MESGDRAQEALTPTVLARSRIRFTVASIFLMTLAFVQSPGALVADTKFNLVANPGRYLATALHLWDPGAAFGQVQNQAYGYLWPMGPFFLLGHELGIPGWVVQRAWLALVLVVAFLGVALVARALGISSDAGAILAGLTYALSPRMLTDLGAISIEVWPMALAPWVLLPLIHGSRRGSPHLAAALAALAVGMIGGVNAAAAAAVLPLGVLWLLTRSSGPRRRLLMIWWPVFTLMATLWWLVPLFLLGRYSPPFLDYIESARVTTLSTPVFDALRGTSNWVPYLDSLARGSNDLITNFYAPLNSGVLLLFGLLGLLLPRIPERRFLVSALLIGLLLVSSSHLGAIQGWFAQDLNNMLDGPLSALRNVHKFDPIVRLPMVLSLAWVFEQSLAIARRGRAGRSALGWGRRALAEGAAVAIPALIVLVSIGASAPAILMRITPVGDVHEIPGYWHEAVNWIDEQHSSGTTLLAPGSSFATYLWGSTRDEPISFLSSRPWAVRNSIPLAPAGNIRMLNAIQDRLVQGRGSTGLADYLRRAGVRFILVRNDLQKGVGLVDPVLVHQALADSPGISQVRTFGPVVGGQAYLHKDKYRVVINQGWQTLYSALEIYEVADSGSQFAQAERSPVVVGGPENLLELADGGLLSDQPSILGFDADRHREPNGPVILTDGLQARAREIGSLANAYSSVQTKRSLLRFVDPRDYLPEGASTWRTWAEYEGVAGLSNSSSMADVGNDLGSNVGAAFDGVSKTYWESVALDPAPWLQVDLEQPMALTELTLTTPEHSPDPQLIRVQTDHSMSPQMRLRAGIPTKVLLDGRQTKWIRIRGESDNGLPMSLAEVEIPGVEVKRTLKMPELPQVWGAPKAIQLTGLLDFQAECARVDLSVRCIDRGRSSGEEEHGLSRTFSIPEAADYELRAFGKPLGGTGLEEMIQQGRFVNVLTDSVQNEDPRGSGLAAVDGDPGTTWIAQPGAKHPTMILSWLQPRVITGLDLSLQGEAPARLPTRMQLSWPGGTRTVEFKDGSARFAGIRTNQLVMRFSSSEKAFGLDFDLRQRGLGIGIGNLNVIGLPNVSAPYSEQPLRRECGSGPLLNLAGQTLQTAVDAAPSDLYAGRSVPLRICGKTQLNPASGKQVVTSESSPAIALSQLNLVQPGFSVLPAADIDGTQVQAGQGLRITPNGSSGLVVHRSNSNPGWVARQGNRELRAQVVDGWQQAWQVRGEQPVLAQFQPDRVYRIGLVAGAISLGLLGLILLLLRRRKPGLELPALAPGRPGRWLVAGFCVAAVGLLAGWWGLIAGCAGYLICRALDRDGTRDLIPWLLSLPVLISAVGYALVPW
ncbi:MAG TPA: alpha-(1-_3)-arabinofuranosyltransferase, partial [Marmoricola sp.]|nr:alpha-(1->3)-arabinofuranosyltransferase [Marmoricola sp.]